MPNSNGKSRSDLLDGNVRFREGKFSEDRELFRQLVEGQSPRALYIGCADSRVVPNFILDVGPGELFVVRNIGGIVPHPMDSASAATGAAVDYAIDVLNVPQVIVCGHDSCGALNAIVSGKAPRGSHLDFWLRRGSVTVDGKDLLDQAGNIPIERLVEKFVENNVATLLTYPTVKRAIEEGRVEVHGWVYDPKTGSLRYLDDHQRWHDGASSPLPTHHTTGYLGPSRMSLRPPSPVDPHAISDS